MRAIWLSAGHTNIKGSDRGSSANGFIEGELTVELRELLSEELEKLGICANLDRNSNNLKETIQFFKNLVFPSSILIDIHFNAATPKSSGTETFIPKNYTKFELNLASEISKCISDTLDIPLRGIVENKLGVKTEDMSARKRLGFMNLTGENLLLEIAFITNMSDMIKYQNNKFILASNLAKILYTYANK